MQLSDSYKRKIFGIFKVVISVIYFIVLSIEGFLLFARLYPERNFVRPLLMPLITIAYLLQVVSKNQLLLVAAVTLSFAADYLTIQYYVPFQWYGLGCYGVTLFCYSVICYLFEKPTLKKSIIPFILSFLGLAIFVFIIEFIGQNRLDFTDKLSVYSYAVVISILSFTGLNVYLNNKEFNFTFVLITLILILSSNLMFMSSVYVFHRRVAYLDSITAFCYGTFQFIFITGTMKVEREKMHKEDLKEFTQIE